MTTVQGPARGGPRTPAATGRQRVFPTRGRGRRQKRWFGPRVGLPASSRRRRRAAAFSQGAAESLILAGSRVAHFSRVAESRVAAPRLGDTRPTLLFSRRRPTRRFRRVRLRLGSPASSLLRRADGERAPRGGHGRRRPGAEVAQLRRPPRRWRMSPACAGPNGDFSGVGAAGLCKAAAGRGCHQGRRARPGPPPRMRAKNENGRATAEPSALPSLSSRPRVAFESFPSHFSVASESLPSRF